MASRRKGKGEPVNPFDRTLTPQDADGILFGGLDPGIQRVAIADMRLDGDTQPREHLNEETIDEYAEAMEAGDEFPPVDLFFDGSNYWLADGFHRIGAAERIGARDHRAIIHQGTRRDAVLFSVGVNAQHGLRRSPEDKRRAVMTLLQDEEWGGWSNREIARRANVSEALVRKVREERMLSAHESQIATGNDDNLSAHESQIDEDSDVETRTVRRGESVYEQRVSSDQRRDAGTAGRGHVSRVMEAVDDYFEQFPGHPTVGISSLVTRTSLTSADVVAACDALVAAGRLVAVIGGQYARPAKPRSTAPTPPPQYPSYPPTPPSARPDPAPRARYASDPDVDQSPVWDEDGVRIAHGEDYDALAARLSEFIGQAIDLAKMLEDLRQTPVPPSYADGLTGQVQDFLDYMTGYDSSRGHVPGVIELLSRLHDRCAAAIVARESGNPGD